MSGNSSYLGLAILNWVRGTQLPTPPATVYVALFNGDPTDAGTGGTEVTNTIHPAGRVAVTFGAPANKAMTNSAVVSFGNAAAGATITHYALFDAATGGDMLASQILSSSPVAIASGAAVSFAAGALGWND